MVHSSNSSVCLFLVSVCVNTACTVLIPKHVEDSTDLFLGTFLTTVSSAAQMGESLETPMFLGASQHTTLVMLTLHLQQETVMADCWFSLRAVSMLIE